MHTDTPDKQGSHFLDLRQFSITLIKSLQFLFDKFPDQAFRVAICEVHLWVKTLSELESTLS
jgi:hypothetical protein